MGADSASEQQYDDQGNAKHYKETRLEVIVMMERVWGTEATMKHCEMTAFKYRMRTGHKEGQSVEQELKKTGWYERKAVELREKLETPNEIIIND